MQCRCTGGCAAPCILMIMMQDGSSSCPIPAGQEAFRGFRTMQKKRRIYISASWIVALIFCFTIYSLQDFNRKIQERQYHIQLANLTDLAVQGGALVEEKLRGYLSALESLAVQLSGKDLKEPYITEQLHKLAEYEDLDFG